MKVENVYDINKDNCVVIVVFIGTNILAGKFFMDSPFFIHWYNSSACVPKNMVSFT